MNFIAYLFRIYVFITVMLLIGLFLSGCGTETIKDKRSLASSNQISVDISSKGVTKRKVLRFLCGKRSTTKARKRCKVKVKRLIKRRKN